MPAKRHEFLLPGLRSNQLRHATASAATTTTTTPCLHPCICPHSPHAHLLLSRGRCRCGQGGHMPAATPRGSGNALRARQRSIPCTGRGGVAGGITGWVNGWMGGWVDGWMGAWRMEGCVDILVFLKTGGTSSCPPAAPRAAAAAAQTSGDPIRTRGIRPLHVRGRRMDRVLGEHPACSTASGIPGRTRASPSGGRPRNRPTHTGAPNGQSSGSCKQQACRVLGVGTCRCALSCGGYPGAFSSLAPLLIAIWTLGSSGGVWLVAAPSTGRCYRGPDTGPAARSVLSGGRLSGGGLSGGG